MIVGTTSWTRCSGEQGRELLVGFWSGANQSWTRSLTVRLSLASDGYIGGDTLLGMIRCEFDESWGVDVG